MAPLAPVMLLAHIFHLLVQSLEGKDMADAVAITLW